MRTDELDYYLPPGLIAQRPRAVRSDSRLLVLSRADGGIIDTKFCRIGEYLRQGDCLVLNDTKVLPARFYTKRATSGKLGGLFIAQPVEGLWEVMLKGAGKVKAGEQIRLLDCAGDDFCLAEVTEKRGAGKCILRIDTAGGAGVILDRIGFPPLPPYIRRTADTEQAKEDRIRYQTVYARQDGAIAAPTAGLHFTGELIEQLRQQGVVFAYATLHIGEGTFKPVTARTLEEHDMHEEHFSIDAANAEAVNLARSNGGRIIAVGTTSVRSLETATVDGRVQPTAAATKLFITPGYRFRIVDAMVTNFHLPRSTLLALVAAFAGLDKIMAAYRHAIEKKYCFYSYGDAMMIT